MRKIFELLVLVLLFNSCERPSECVESSGAIIVKDVAVSNFKKIKVYKGIEVVIKQGDVPKVQIEAGENFIDNIEVIQIDDQLIFKDRTSCNWVRAYGTTKILVTTPTLEEVYSKTDRKISSNGVLTFPNLSLISLDKDADGEKGAGTGDFILNINNQSITVSNNNVSRFFLTGQTNTANFNFYFGDGRIEAQHLVAQNITVFHRGSNDMIVYPVVNLSGELYSTGYLVSKNHPSNSPQVTAHYNGQLIFE